MNGASLLAHYERIADAPDAIGRLRRLVLDLAVQGKLVPQVAGEKSSAEQLKSARRRLETAAKSVGRLRWQPSAPIAESGLSIPAGWIIARLNDTGLYVNGLAFKPSDWQREGLPIIRIQNLTDPSKEFNFAKGEFPDEVIVRNGDLLVSWSATLEAFRWTRGRGVLNQHIFRVIPDEGLTTRDYLLLLLRNAIREMADSEHAHGLVMTHINRGPFLDHIVFIPPLAEQKRIVAKVDELMALCDRLEAARVEREATRDRLTAASLARLSAPDPKTFQADARFVLNALPALTARPDQIKQLRQTILNLAVRGKLVPQDRNDEPASELLKRVAEKRTAAKKVRRNGEVDISSLRTDTPLASGWQWTNIDEIALSMRYGTSVKCERATPGIPVLRIPNVSGGFVSLEDIKFGPLTENEVRDLALNAGDLLMIRSNGSLDIVGRSAVVPAEADGMAFAGYLVRLRLSLANVRPEYVWLALNSTDVRDQIERPIRSAVGLKNINLTEFGALAFPLPPFAEQHRIVAKVDELMALCDRLEAVLLTSNDARRHLLEALLAEALAPVEARAEKAA